VISASGSSQCSLLALIAAIIILVSAPPFTSIPNAAAEVQIDSSRNLSAVANSLNEELGIITVMSIGATDSKSEVGQHGQETSDQNPTSGARIAIRQFTFETICDEFGECFERPVFLMRLNAPQAANSSIAIAPDDFQPTNQLSVATLSLEALGFDSVSGTEKTIQVDLEWTGVGEISRGTDVKKLELGDDCTLISRSSGAFRFATVEGTLSVDGKSLPTPDFQGTLSRGNGMTIFNDC
jgi:hypothetical protein